MLFKTKSLVISQYRFAAEHLRCSFKLKTLKTYKRKSFKMKHKLMQIVINHKNNKMTLKSHFWSTST